MTELNTGIEHVRPQIDAAKQYLRDEGFISVEDTPVAQGEEFDGLHTIHAVYGSQVRTMRLKYTWLEEHQPSEVRTWLAARQIGLLLRQEYRHIEVHEDANFSHGTRLK
jgi:hypothetical protein